MVGVFCSCENDIAEVEKLSQDTLLPDQSARNVDIQYSQKGLVVLRVQAPLLNQFGGKEPYNEMPEGVKVETYDSAKNVSSVLTANYAIQYTNTEVMEAKYNVVVINDKGEKLNTEHLTYDPKEEQIVSDEFVKITTKDQVIMGEGLIADQDFSNYKILKPKGVINIEDDKVD